MSASTMAEQGKKTQAKVLKALGKRPKTAQQVAAKVGISRGMASRHLQDLRRQKAVTSEQNGRFTAWALATAPSETGRPSPASV